MLLLLSIHMLYFIFCDRVSTYMKNLQCYVFLALRYLCMGYTAFMLDRRSIHDCRARDGAKTGKAFSATTRGLSSATNERVDRSSYARTLYNCVRESIAIVPGSPLVSIPYTSYTIHKTPVTCHYHSLPLLVNETSALRQAPPSSIYLDYAPVGKLCSTTPSPPSRRYTLHRSKHQLTYSG